MESADFPVDVIFSRAGDPFLSRCGCRLYLRCCRCHIPRRLSLTGYQKASTSKLSTWHGSTRLSRQESSAKSRPLGSAMHSVSDMHADMCSGPRLDCLTPPPRSISMRSRRQDYIQAAGQCFVTHRDRGEPRPSFQCSIRTDSAAETHKYRQEASHLPFPSDPYFRR